jgi:hypothetical protein
MYLEISVNNVPGVEVVKRPYHTRRAETSSVLIESSPGGETHTHTRLTAS